MNRKPGATKPSEAEIAEAMTMTLHQIGRAMAALRIAQQRKQAEKRGRSRSVSA